MSKSREAYNKRGLWKKIKSIGLVVILIGLIGSTIGLAVKLDKQTTTNRLGATAWSIGGISSAGEITSTDATIYSKAVTVEGFKVDIDDNTDEKMAISYKLYFYDEDGDFINATSAYTVDKTFDASTMVTSGSTAKTVRVVITPTGDVDGHVTLLEKGGYVGRLTVTYNR